MWYTVWRKLSPTTYKFYMAAEVLSVALNSAPEGAVITKTPHSYSTNYVHINDIKSHKI